MKESDTVNDKQIIKLIQSVKKSDQDKAFSMLYDRYANTVYSLVHKNSGTETQAEDVFQDTLIVLHSKLRDKSFKLTCKLNTYIYSVARNLWLNQLRKRSKVAQLEDQEEEFIDISENSLDVLQRTQGTHVLNALIMKLGEGCQKVLKYFYFEEMNLKGIAAELGYANESVAKTKKSKCLKQLRDLVKNEPHIKTTLWTS